jgi:hypothetical protein
MSLSPSFTTVRLHPISIPPQGRGEGKIKALRRSCQINPDKYANLLEHILVTMRLLHFSAAIPLRNALSTFPFNLIYLFTRESRGI